jgi:hypothetical protein
MKNPEYSAGRKLIVNSDSLFSKDIYVTLTD